MERLTELRMLREQRAALKLREDKIVEELAAEYAEQLKGMTGTVTVDGIKFGVPKTVKWDQAKLADLWLTIEKAGKDPFDYMNVTRDVPENRYKNWPSDIREAFEPARTVKTGKVTIKLEDEE